MLQKNCAPSRPRASYARPLLCGLLTALGALASCGDAFHVGSQEPDPGSQEPDPGSGGTSSGGAFSAEGGASGEANESSAGQSSGAGADGEAGAGSAGESSGGCATDRFDCNDDPKDGCEASSSSPEHCGACGAACPAIAPLCTLVSGKLACTAPAAVVAQRLELPCVEDVKTPELCSSVAGECPEGGKVVNQSFILEGSAQVTYDITLRVRGVLEPRVYTGGKQSGDHFYVGGAPQPESNYNAVSIAVSTPAKTYYLNAADAEGETYEVLNLDYEAVVTAKGGAKITLGLTDLDCRLVRNCQSFDGACTPYAPTGVPPAPAGFNGQFVQLDLVSVMPAP
jgi:hypothetical protein